MRRKELAPVVVPQLLLLADESRRVRTAAVWSARMEKSFFFRKRYFPSPEVFPECDLLILTAGSETRYASRDEAVGQLGSTVHANNLEDAGRVYKELKSAQTGRLKEIGPDGFIDVLI
ncbi:MAG: hypothetical protein KGN84_19350 [Acidobacteriota bacterium]|nr:hypothetical protein [Acidobacteriota bacterium]